MVFFIASSFRLLNGKRDYFMGARPERRGEQNRRNPTFLWGRREKKWRQCPSAPFEKLPDKNITTV
jgi:hypothetical protein